MSFLVRRPRAALRKLDPRQEFWEEGKIVLEEKGYVLETYWKNPEIAGIWLLRFPVLWKCFEQLAYQQLIELDTTEKIRTYRLSKKGSERLGIV